MGQTVILHTTLARIGPVTRAIAVIVVESLGTIAQKLSTKVKRGFLLISLKKNLPILITLDKLIA